MNLAMQLAMDRLCWSGSHGKPTVRSWRQIRDASKNGVPQTTRGTTREEVLLPFQVAVRRPCVGSGNALRASHLGAGSGARTPRLGAPCSGTPRTAQPGISPQRLSFSGLKYGPLKRGRRPRQAAGRRNHHERTAANAGPG